MAETETDVIDAGLKNRDLNPDGGRADEVYLPEQKHDGGDANG